jgi:DNA-directed RNA polymerase
MEEGDPERLYALQRDQIAEAAVMQPVDQVLETADYDANPVDMIRTVTRDLDEVVTANNTLHTRLIDAFSQGDHQSLFTPAQLAVNYIDYRHALSVDILTTYLNFHGGEDAERTREVERHLQLLLESSMTELDGVLRSIDVLFPEANVTPAQFMEQIKLEQSALHVAAEKYQRIYNDMVRMGKGANMRPAQKYVVGWFEPLRVAIEKEFALINGNVRGPDRKIYGPYLTMLNAAELSCITIHEVMNRVLSTPDGVRSLDAAVAIGRAVNVEVNLLRLRENKSVWSRMSHVYPKHKLTGRIVMDKSKAFSDNPLWSEVIQAKVGSVLLHLLLRTAEVDVVSRYKNNPRSCDKNINLFEEQDAPVEDNEVVSHRFDALPVDKADDKADDKAEEHPAAAPSNAEENAEANGESETNVNANVDAESDVEDADDMARDADASVEDDSEGSEAEAADPAAATDEQVAIVDQFTEGDLAQYYQHDGMPAVDEAGKLMLPPPVMSAFIFRQERRGMNITGLIACHPRVLTTINDAHEYISSLSPRMLPMVIPPRPWRGLRDGGYLTVTTSIIRTKGSQKQAQAVAESTIPEVYDSLNKMGRVAWAINQNIIPILDQVWARGGQFADVPSRTDIPLPPAPVLDATTAPEGHLTEEEMQARMDMLQQETKALKQWQRDINAINQMNADMHSLRCDFQLKLNQAKQLAEFPIYFPFNLDFRGRAYPVPPHLNHLGSDVARGLLLFNEAKPLGPNGLYWLYAHLAAQFGVDKVSFDDRVAFARSKFDLIQQCTEDPFLPNVPNPGFKKRRGLEQPRFLILPEVIAKYRRREARMEMQMRRDLGLTVDESKYADLDLSIDDGDFDGCDLPYDGEYDVNPSIPWWMTADSPWQALATCYEIINAERSGNPAEYMSRMPVHQDGSCNGLQHYAALGRDELGGSRVNLLPADKPQDVYTHVLNQVKVLMEKDVQEGNNLARMLLPHMTRKVVKQTVMTSVYGVTFIGARDQVLRQLKDLKNVNWELGFSDEQLTRLQQSLSATCADGENDSDSHKLNTRREVEQVMQQSSVYVARLTLNSLSTVFTGAKAIMTWLAQCAHLMAQDQQPVSWVTPLGLPVTQPYRKATSFQVTTLMQTMTFHDDTDTLPVSGQRQKAAFPPNFVHSLDATHMMLTARDCIEKGLTFSSVHDSFWTHAADVDIMNESLRDQFVNLYSQPVLEELRANFVARFPNIEFPPLPQRGTLDLNMVRKSNYFFS